MLKSLFQQVLISPNALIDCTFYNVGALDRNERNHLKYLGIRHQESPGTLVVVQPAKSTATPRIKLVFGKQWMLHVEGVDTVVMAGVGSSILGTAALARDIANQLDRPVIGVVSGFGLSSVAIDGITGFFKYEPLNLMSEWFTRNGSPQELDPAVVTVAGEAKENDPPQEILQKLICLPGITRAIGHSKGSLELGNAVLAEQAALSQRSVKLKVGTLGAVVSLPDYVNQCQALGSLDLLGLANSRIDVARNTVIGANHWLNPDLPFSMSIREHIWGEFGADNAFSS